MTPWTAAILKSVALTAIVVSPLRAAAQPPDPSRASGKEVRVPKSDGLRSTGSLVSLSDTEVTLRRDGADHRLLLSEVERVQRVRHRARTWALWAGGITGLALGALEASYHRHEGDGEALSSGLYVGLLWGGVAAGAGAATGALIDSATAEGNVLYRKPLTRSFQLSPQVSRKETSVALSLSW